MSKGDAAAFEVLMDCFYPACYQTALKVLLDADLAKDIVQEVFLKVWLRRSGLNTVENFGGWLRSVTVNQVYDHIKKSNREKGKMSQWSQEFNLLRTDEIPVKEEIELERLIDEAILILPEKQKQAFILIKKEGRSREEAAQIQGVSSETIKTNLERAMRSIRAYCLGKLDETSLFVIFSLIFEKVS